MAHFLNLNSYSAVLIWLVSLSILNMIFCFGPSRADLHIQNFKEISKVLFEGSILDIHLDPDGLFRELNLWDIQVSYTLVKHGSTLRLGSGFYFEVNKSNFSRRLRGQWSKWAQGGPTTLLASDRPLYMKSQGFYDFYYRSKVFILSLGSCARIFENDIQLRQLTQAYALCFSKGGTAGKFESQNLRFFTLFSFYSFNFNLIRYDSLSFEHKDYTIDDVIQTFKYLENIKIQPYIKGLEMYDKIDFIAMIFGRRSKFSFSNDIMRSAMQNNYFNHLYATRQLLCNMTRRDDYQYKFLLFPQRYGKEPNLDYKSLNVYHENELQIFHRQEGFTFYTCSPIQRTGLQFYTYLAACDFGTWSGIGLSITTLSFLSLYLIEKLSIKKFLDICWEHFCPLLGQGMNLGKIISHQNKLLLIPLVFWLLGGGVVISNGYNGLVTAGVIARFRPIFPTTFKQLIDLGYRIMDTFNFDLKNHILSYFIHKYGGSLHSTEIRLENSSGFPFLDKSENILWLIDKFNISTFAQYHAYINSPFTSYENHLYSLSKRVILLKQEEGWPTKCYKTAYIIRSRENEILKPYFEEFHVDKYATGEVEFPATYGYFLSHVPPRLAERRIQAIIGESGILLGLTNIQSPAMHHALTNNLNEVLKNKRGLRRGEVRAQALNSNIVTIFVLWGFALSISFLAFSAERGHLRFILQFSLKNFEPLYKLFMEQIFKSFICTTIRSKFKLAYNLFSRNLELLRASILSRFSQINMEIVKYSVNFYRNRRNFNNMY